MRRASRGKAWTRRKCSALTSLIYAQEKPLILLRGYPVILEGYKFCSAAACGCLLQHCSAVQGLSWANSDRLESSDRRRLLLTTGHSPFPSHQSLIRFRYLASRGRVHFTVLFDTRTIKTTEPRPLGMYATRIWGQTLFSNQPSV